MHVLTLAPPEALLLEGGEHRLAGRETLHAAEGLGRNVAHVGVGRHDIEGREAGTLTDLEIVRVVRRRDLDHARAEVGVDELIRNHRDRATGQRKLDLDTHEPLVALVSRVDGDTRVAEHRLGTRR